jgi:hypothetical protein
MQSESRSCKAYKQKDNISDLFLDTIPVNCGNCEYWSIRLGRCKDEHRVVAMQTPKEVVAFARY